jgi:hypothetical protein
LLEKFTELDMFVDSLDSQDIFLSLGKYIPNAVCKPLSGVLGWFLYAKGTKPNE